jgi:hypothetical protein
MHSAQDCQATFQMEFRNNFEHVVSTVENDPDRLTIDFSSPTIQDLYVNHA